MQALQKRCDIKHTCGFISMSVFIAVFVIIRSALARFAAFSSYFGHMLFVLTHRLAAFTACFTRFFRIEFMRMSRLMSGLSALAGTLARLSS
jgi:hypothetical protein